MAENIKYENYKNYIDKLNHESLKSALNFALAQRNFEIELYFKRSAYFWTFVGASFVAFFASKAQDELAFLISCLGAIFTFGWYWVNRGNSYWHVSWDIQVRMLGNRLYGPLFDPHLKGCSKFNTGPFRVSISGINEFLSLYVILVWVFLAVRAICQVFNFFEPFTGFNIIVVGIITILWAFFILKKCVGDKNGRDLELEVPDYRSENEK